MIDLHTIPEFLDAGARAALVDELRASAGAASTVLAQQEGGRVQNSVRRSTRVSVTPETMERVHAAFTARRAELEAHFGMRLAACEEPQFLRYEEGDFFVPHQDGNTPMVYDKSRFRRISAVLFLSPRSEQPAEGTYGGGELVFHGHYATEPNLRVSADADPGTLVAFRAETTHEVTPVTHGERYTVVTWFHTGDEE